MLLLDIRNLNIEVKTPQGTFKAVENFNLTLEQGEIRALIGESGSGRSLIAKAILGIEKENVTVHADRIFFYHPKDQEHHQEYVDLMRLTRAQRRHIMTQEIAVIFQDPSSFFDPSQTIKEQLLNLIPPQKKWQKYSPHKQEHEANLIRFLHKAGIKNHQDVLLAYPFELSGGICQKIMIAMAISMKPRLLIADEPTSIMDTSTQTQILRMLDKMNKMHNMSTLLISNELNSIAKFAHTFSFIYCGQLVETGSQNAIFKNPKHPYTKALIHAIPGLHEIRLPKSDLYTLPGLIPTLDNLPIGCRLGPRCPNAQRKCIQRPNLTEQKKHAYYCHYPMPNEEK